MGLGVISRSSRTGNVMDPVSYATRGGNFLWCCGSCTMRVGGVEHMNGPIKFMYPRRSYRLECVGVWGGDVASLCDERQNYGANRRLRLRRIKGES